MYFYATMQGEAQPWLMGVVVMVSMAVACSLAGLAGAIIPLTLQRLGAWRLALFAVPVYYAAVHFLGRAASVPHEEVNALSGFTALAGFFSGFADPLGIADAFVALWFVGLLLALVRRYWGDLAGCIGLHAGFVTIIALFRKVSAPVPDGHWAFLVGGFDGLLGLWIALLTGLCCLWLWSWQRRHAAP